jgi:phosphoglycolate phosphatase/putative hydrolase of the HAD superfamily
MKVRSVTNSALPVSERFAPRAIIFDVDGTLYDQRTLRLKMLATLVKAHALRPAEGWRTASVLKAYRRAQEDLRHSPHENPAARQAEIACAKTGSTPLFVQQCVERWMETEPLAFLPACIRPGLLGFLDACRGRGLRLAALSDYPAQSKLEALGIASAFELVLCAQSLEIGRFKPDPRGLLVTLDRLGVKPEDAMYVGDRPEVDAAAAAAAGVACAIVTRATARRGAFWTVRGYDELAARMFGGSAAARP